LRIGGRFDNTAATRRAPRFRGSWCRLIAGALRVGRRSFPRRNRTVAERQPVGRMIGIDVVPRNTTGLAV
jgi:hypothetical protein